MLQGCSYDEDLYENPFFIVLEKHHKALFEKATANRWVICIPQFSCVKKQELARQDFEDHILIPSENNDSAFFTVSHHKVEIQQGQINLDAGFKANKVDILFEETFYNSRDESYRVVCVSGMFNRLQQQGDFEESGIEMALRLPVSYEECINILWGHQGSTKTREILDKMLKTCCLEYQRFEGTAESIPNLADLVSGHITKAMQLVLKDNHIKQLVKQHSGYMASLKVAVETYLMNAVHKHLFSTITACVKSADAVVNKMTRNLVDIRLQHLEIRQEFQENLPYAKKELAKLNQYSTPLGRVLCLKRVVTALTKPLFKGEDDNKSGGLMMTTDDLLPLLIYLIIKSQIPNWTANLAYMKHFQMAKMTESDEFSFYLATTEAALDYISSGNLRAAKPLEHKEGGFTRQTSGSSTSTKEKFFQYVQYGDEAAVTLMLKKQKRGVDDFTSTLCHPLCTCVNCTEITARSSQNSGAISTVARDDMGRTALHIAAFYGQGNLIDLLAKQGSRIDATDYLGCTPLHLAAQKGYQSIILLLVHFGADIGAIDNEGNTPLHLCAKNGHEDCVKAVLFLDILKNKLNVNAQNDMGDTPLHLAARWGYDGIVSFLLESEADPRIRNRKRQTPFNVAQNADIKKELEAFMKEPPPTVITHTGRPTSLSVTSSVRTPPASSTSSSTDPPSSTPSQPKQEPVVSPSTSTKSPHGFSVVDVKPVRSSVQLIDNPSREMMSPTTPAVASLDQGDTRQIERLFKAIANKDLPLVQYYFGWVEDSASSEDSPVSPPSTSSPVDSISSRLCHPLCQCDKCKHLQKHSTLNTLDVNCQNRKGFAPLHICIIENNMEVLDLLLMKGALVNIQTHKQITPLHLACFHDNFEIVQKLVSRGADVNLQDQHGEIPLHLAAAKANIQIAKYLIEHSSSVNLGNINGNTCLHHAVCKESVEVVRVLLDHGALPDVVNKHNQSPADFAKKQVIIDLLKKKQEELHRKAQQTFSESLKLTSLDKLKEMAADLDDENLKSLKQISEGIKSFNKLTTLKRSKTFDHSSSLLNSARLKLSLSIQHFDKSKSLRRIKTLDRSSPMLSPSERSLSICQFDTGSLKHIEPVDKSDPLYLYTLTRSFSSYHDYRDTPTEELSMYLEGVKDEVGENSVKDLSDLCSAVNTACLRDSEEENQSFEDSKDFGAVDDSNKNVVQDLSESFQKETQTKYSEEGRLEALAEFDGQKERSVEMVDTPTKCDSQVEQVEFDDRLEKDESPTDIECGKQKDTVELTWDSEVERSGTECETKDTHTEDSLVSVMQTTTKCDHGESDVAASNDNSACHTEFNTVEDETVRS